MHGDKDNTAPISQSETFAQTLKQAGAETAFVAVKGAGI
jgi:dipeptidyl aminopeptidase/acylaminoacyl peptidase